MTELCPLRQGAKMRAASKNDPKFDHNFAKFQYFSIKLVIR